MIAAGVGHVITGFVFPVAVEITTFTVFEAARKFVVRAVAAFTTQVPVPPELNAPVVAVALTNAQGPPVVLNVIPPLELVEALTVKLPPGNVGAGASSECNCRSRLADRDVLRV